MNERETILNDAQQVIEWFRAHPDIPLPYAFTDAYRIYSWDSKEEAAKLARAFGSCEKVADDDAFRLQKRIGGAIIEGYFTRSSVCERVVVGTKDVEVDEVDPVALAALPKTKVKRQVEVVEWRCPELLPEVAK